MYINIGNKKIGAKVQKLSGRFCNYKNKRVFKSFKI